jgi:DNA-binding response OmpR family regulator
MSLKILYIDDEQDLCQMFEDNFGMSNDVTIDTFTDPEKGLSALPSIEPDLIFLDYRLPNTTGVEIANRIQAKIPIALVTGELGMKLQPPFIRIFWKPFDFEEIEKFIEFFAEQKRSKPV